MGKFPIPTSKLQIKTQDSKIPKRSRYPARPLRGSSVANKFAPTDVAGTGTKPSRHKAAPTDKHACATQFIPIVGYIIRLNPTRSNRIKPSGATTGLDARARAP